MLECFDGLITLDDTCAGNTGALPLQSLGITETLLADITGSEDTPSKLLGQVETWARHYMATDVLNRFGTRILLGTMVDRQRLGDPDDGAVTPPVAGSIGGIVIEVDPVRSDLALQVLGVRYHGGAPPPITIYDLGDGSTVATLATPVRHTIITLPAHGRRVAYLIATAATDYASVVLPGASCGSCGGAWRTGPIKAYGARVPGGMPVRKATLMEAPHTSGLGIDITLSCDHAALLCKMRGDLALPYLYKVGQGIMDRALAAGKRMNATAANAELLAGRAAQYEQEYGTAIGNIVKGARLPADGMCYHCASEVRIITALP